MKNIKIKLSIFYILILLINNAIFSQNPVIRDQYTADPTARVFEDVVYVYPSHDIANQGKGRMGWFCMEDYHVFSSSNLTEWKDHGVIISQYGVNWVDSTRFSMWAPDCIEKDGKYYFYFPAGPKDTIYGRGFSIGVAISDKPYGPFTPQQAPIKNVHGIDPNPFIDKDGQSYLFYSLRKIFVAKLKENMLELATKPVVIDNLPTKGLIEGPFMFERNGIYYLTYPHVEDSTERLEYAMGESPMGPFKVVGAIMDESKGCWTNHQSIIKFKDQWYLFYHNSYLSPKNDKNRSICVDSLFFNADGTIQKVLPSLRGVGITKASQKIEIDRYSFKSDTGITIAFNDTLNTFNGWKAILDNQNAWIQYNAVDFGNEKYKSVRVMASSETGGTLQIRLDKVDGLLISEVIIPKSNGWSTFDTNVLNSLPGKHNLAIILKDVSLVEIDWIRFIN